MKHPFALYILLCLALSPSAATAQTDPPPVPAELRGRFGFLGPKLHKVSDGIELLRPSGSKLLVNNPLRGRLEVLTVAVKGAKRADMKQWEVAAASISTSGELRGLAFGDVDGDGTPDVLMLNTRGRLITVPQGKGKATNQIPELEVGAPKAGNSLRVADLDGDRRVDAILLTENGLQVVTNIAGSAVVHPAAPLFADRVENFLVFDFNGDGKHDVVICSNDARVPLHYKQGLGGAAFGPWTLLTGPQMAGAFIGSGAGKRPSIATIQNKPRRLTEYVLETARDALRPAQELTSFPRGAAERPFVHGDIDGDGDLDLVLADPARASLTYLIEQDGAFQQRTVPCLSGIQSLTLGDLDRDGKPDLIIASPEEEALAVRWGKDKLDTFPTRLPSKDRPIAATVVADCLLFLSRDKKKVGTLSKIAWDDEGKPGEPQKLAELGRLSRDPRQLWAANLDRKPGQELVFVVPGSELQVLFPDGKGGYEQRSSGGAGFTKRIADGAVSVTGTAGRRALMVVRERFARVFRFDQQGQPRILTQDNGPEGIRSMAMATTMEDGSRLYLDRKNNRLYRTQDKRPTVSIDMPAISPTHLLAHGDAALVIGQRGVLRVPFRRSFRLKAMRVLEPPTKKSFFWKGIATDLDGDGKKELALLDANLHGVHVLVSTENKLERALSFPVFEAPDGRRRFEPREIAAADVDGDGRQDLILIAHDRILIYPQER